MPRHRTGRTYRTNEKGTAAPRPARPVRVLGWVFSRRREGGRLVSEVGARKEMAARSGSSCGGHTARELAGFRAEPHGCEWRDEAQSLWKQGGMVEESFRLGRCRLCRNRSPGPHMEQVRPIQIQDIESDVNAHGQAGREKHPPPNPRSPHSKPNQPHNPPLRRRMTPWKHATRATPPCQPQHRCLHRCCSADCCTVRALGGHPQSLHI